MRKRSIGGIEVGAVGLGCMGMSWAYGKPNDEESLLVLDRALELGVNHWDTADVYGAGENETLVSQRLRMKRDQVFLATKFGNVYDRSLTSHKDLVEAGQGWIVDGTPAYARKCVDASLSRLGIETIDLYYLHRVDPRVPIEETVGEMSRLVAEGKVKYIGVSEVGAETVRRANKIHPLAAVQNECSLWTRDSIDDVLPVCEELGIAFVAYSPLGRGFLTGQIKSPDDLAPEDARRNHPRFQGENFQANLDTVAKVERIAEELGATPSQVAIAWTLGLSQNILPIPGTKRLKYLEDNAAADDLVLTSRQLEELNAITEATGERYAAGGKTYAKA